MKIRMFVILAAALLLTAIVSPVQAMYHPGMGRFMQRDPGPGGTSGSMPSRVGHAGINRQYADGMNLYQYVRSNPIRYVDFTGWQAAEPEKPYFNTISFNDYWDKWSAKNYNYDGRNIRPEIRDDIINAKSNLERGCVGVVCANLKLPYDNARSWPNTSDCYATLEAAKKRKSDCPCKDGETPRIISAKFWSEKEPVPNDKGVISVDPAAIDKTPSPTGHPFDYAIQDDATGYWWGADHAHDPLGIRGKDGVPNPMNVQVSNDAVWSSPKTMGDYNRRIYCVTCGPNNISPSVTIEE